MSGTNESEKMTELYASITRLQSISHHTSDVNSVAFGRNFILASASSDKKTKICKWDKHKGFVESSSSPLKDHKYGVTCVEFSPYGTILATSSVDGTTILWDPTNGDKLGSLVQPGNAAVRVCSFSVDCSKILTAGDSGVVFIWDVSTKSLQRSLFGHEEAIFGANFAPDGSYLVSGCSAGLLYLWNGSGTGSCNKPLALVENAHDLGVTSIAFFSSLVSNNGGFGKLCLMVTGGHDHLVKLWNVSFGIDHFIEPLRVLHGHSATVMCVQTSPGDEIIASASGDKTVRLWKVSGKCIKVLEGHDRFVTSCAFSSDGKLLVSGSNDKKVVVWDLTRSVKLGEELGGLAELSADKLWPRYENLCKSRMLQEKNGVVLKAKFHISKCDFNSCVIVGTSMVIAATSSSKSVCIWDLDTKKELEAPDISTHKYAVNSLAYSTTTGILASASSDGSINLVNLSGLERVTTLFQPSGGALRVVRMSPDGSLLIAGGDDESACLWDLKTGSVIREYNEHQASIFAAGFSPDGIYAVTGCSNGLIKLWNCQSDSEVSIGTQEAHELGVTACEFSPKGLRGAKGSHRLLLASGGNDAVIRLYQITITPDSTATFSNWQTMKEHGASNVMSVAFAPSGKLLASAAGDQTVRLWEVCSGLCLQVIEGHDRYVTCCSFSQSGSYLVTCSSDHTVKVWELHGSLACETTNCENVAVESMICKWTTEDVVNWLAEIGLGHFGQSFEENNINGEKLFNLTEGSMITELKMEDPNIRKQILTELQWLKSLGLNETKTSTRSETITAPIEFFCPVTHDIMVEPVSTNDGHTYERAAITEWFLTGKTTSPLTNLELTSLALTPNFELQNRISEFLANRLKTE